MTGKRKARQKVRAKESIQRQLEREGTEQFQPMLVGLRDQNGSTAEFYITRNGLVFETVKQRGPRVRALLIVEAVQKTCREYMAEATASASTPIVASELLDGAFTSEPDPVAPPAELAEATHAT